MKPVDFVTKQEGKPTSMAIAHAQSFKYLKLSSRLHKSILFFWEEKTRDKKTRQSRSCRDGDLINLNELYKTLLKMEAVRPRG